MDEDALIRQEATALGVRTTLDTELVDSVIAEERVNE